jgi:hypothetical protein
MKRVRQRTVSHCGPAVLEMLCSYIGQEVDQDTFVEASSIGYDRFYTHGMTIDEMSYAVTKAVPEGQFWFKDYSSVSELTQIVRVYKYPVGIEWQGIFDYEIEEDTDDEYGEEDDDEGHYSVVTDIDSLNNQILISDPERHYAGVDRKFRVMDFVRRWWDENKVFDLSGKLRYEEDFRVMFIVTPKDSIFPEHLGMMKGKET